jgi:EpsI family protein
MLVLSLMLLAASAYLAKASKPEIVPIREPLSGMPMQIEDWAGQQAPDMDPRVVAVLGVDDYLNRIYDDPAHTRVGLYVGYYASQREGATIHSPLNCLPGAGWNPVKRDRIPVSVEINGKNAGNYSTIEINRIVILKGVEKQLVLYWYQSHGRVVASEYWGKIYTVLDALRKNRTDAALVRVICPVVDGSEKAEIIAEENAIDFVRALFPLLSRFLPG